MAFCPGKLSAYKALRCERGLASLVGMTTNKKLIVAIHGAGLQGSYFGALAPHVIDYTFKAVTLPGHDTRRSDVLCADIPAMAAWLRSEIETLPAGYDIILLGHSMGALVALEAGDHPRVTALILTGAAAAMPVNPDLLSQAQADAAAAGALIAKWSIARQHPQADTLREVLGHIMAAVPPAALAVDLVACDAYQNAAEAAARVQKPALVLAGDADRMTPIEGAQALADMLPQGVLAIMNETGHMPSLERPLETGHEIKGFLGA